MKPVENYTQSMFKVGHTYFVLSDEDEEETELESIQITKIHPCPSLCKDIQRGCEGVRLVITKGTEWCGIPANFEEDIR